MEFNPDGVPSSASAREITDSYINEMESTSPEFRKGQLKSEIAEMEDSRAPEEEIQKLRDQLESM